MAYLQHTSWKDRPGAVAGVIAVHAAIGFVLVNGLEYVSNVIKDKPLVGTEVEVPIEPPPPPPTDEPSAKVIPERPTVAPLPPLDLSDHSPPADTTTIILPALPEIPRILPSATPGVDVGLKPAFDPVPARPRNDPAGWVSTSDYRSSWINREWTGTASFRVEVSADGRVANCTIVGSSGHAELDQATCDLVSRRARFDAARNARGEKTSGSYASAVRWELPR
jgi:protein TonB